MTYSTKQFAKDLCKMPAYAGAKAINKINAYGLEKNGSQQQTSDAITSTVLGATLGAMASYAITTGSLNTYEQVTAQETTTQTPEEVLTTTTTHPVRHQSKMLGALHPVIGVGHHVLTREPASHTIRMRGRPQEDLERITITAPRYEN